MNKNIIDLDINIKKWMSTQYEDCPICLETMEIPLFRCSYNKIIITNTR